MAAGCCGGGIISPGAVGLRPAYTVLSWGASTVTGGTDNLHAGIVDSSAVGTLRFAHTATRTGTLKRMVLRHNLTDPGGDLVYVVVVQGVVTPLALTLDSGTTGPVANLTTEVFVRFGFSMVVRVTNTTGGGRVVNPVVDIEFHGDPV